jgi:hypothetical protein
MTRPGLEPGCPYGRSSLSAMRIPISPASQKITFLKKV